MKVFELHSSVWIEKPPEEIFPFFADAANLDLLTPGWLRFRIVSPQPIEMRQGTRIDYRLRIHGLPIRWRSCITSWQPPHLFVDEQVRGPYRLWTHEHQFRPFENGTMVEDRVRYAVWGGRVVDRLLVAPDLARIFDYRRSKLIEELAVGNPDPRRNPGTPARSPVERPAGRVSS